MASTYIPSGNSLGSNPVPNTTERAATTLFICSRQSDNHNELADGCGFDAHTPEAVRGLQVYTAENQRLAGHGDNAEAESRVVQQHESNQMA